MTVEKLKKEADIIANNDLLESYLWYLNEYKDEISPSDIAEIFINACYNMIITCTKEQILEDLRELLREKE